jgi:hypothetical protein
VKAERIVRLVLGAIAGAFVVWALWTMNEREWAIAAAITFAIVLGVL